MKIFSKLIVGLTLSSVHVLTAPLEARQSVVNSIDAAVNRLLSRVLTEVYNLNTALTTLTTLPSLPSLTTVQNDINSITTNLESASSVLSNATAVTGCDIGVADVVTLLGNLGMAQSLVAELEGTLSSLTPGQSTSLTSPLTTLETAINAFNVDLQSYAQSLLPCINEVAPTLLAPVETLLEAVGNGVSGLLDTLGLGSAVGEVAGIIP